MKIDQLKSNIESNNIQAGLYVFLCKHGKFIAEQYIKQISKISEKHLNYVLEFNDYLINSTNLFGDYTDDSIDIISVKKLDLYSQELLKKKFCIIITEDINDNVIDAYENYIVEFPKLESWQIKDYIYSLADGTNTKYLDWLQSICKDEIYRIDNELHKFQLFDKSSRTNLFEQMVTDNAFEDLSTNSIFDFTNALIAKDRSKLLEIFDELSSIDIEPIGVVTIMYNQFKKLILVWLSRNPTEESTGLSKKQIYAINKLPRTFTQKQLLDIFDMLTQIDYKLKTGEIEAKYIIDYIVCKIFTA